MRSKSLRHRVLNIFLLAAGIANFAQGAGPQIAGFAPSSGDVGTTVTITGANFDSAITNDVVFFGAVKATVATAASTQLEVTVPSGATYSAISVTTGDGFTAYSRVPFVPTFSPGGIIESNSFARKVGFAAADSSYNFHSLAIGDLDDDGKPDLILINYNANVAAVYRNTSVTGRIDAESFSPKVDFATGSYPVGVAIADLDGDGKLDIVVANSVGLMGSRVSVLQNTSTRGSITSGSFAPKADFTVGGIPTSVAIADLDMDGRPDLVVATANTVYVLRNTGTRGIITNGSFAVGVDFPGGGNTIATGDLDGDAKPDLVLADGNTVSVFRNTSTSGSIMTDSLAPKVDFSTGTGPMAAAIADLDGDGRQDIIAVNWHPTDGQSNGQSNTNSFSVLRNTATVGSLDPGSFAPPVDFLAGRLPTLAVGDLDGDGKLDLVVLDYNLNRLSTSVYKNTAVPSRIDVDSFATKVDFPGGGNSITLGDLDADGKTDIAVFTSYDYTLDLYRNTIMAPEIITQPQSQTLIVGTNATFSVEAAGPVGRYQWRYNDTNIFGATNSSLTLSNIQPNYGGSYTVVISNPLGTATSAPAFLDVRFLLAFGNGQLLPNAQYTFVGLVRIDLQSAFSNGTIFYTLDGSSPNYDSHYYNEAFTIRSTATMRAITYSSDFSISEEAPPITIVIIPVYCLSATTGGGGSIVINPPSGPYISNTLVNLRAWPAEGWSLLGWTGDASGSNSVTSVTMTRNKCVQAVFGTTIDTSVPGNGSILGDPFSVTYPYGRVVRFTALPQAGYYFSRWVNAATGTNNPLDFIVTTANPTISALFAPLNPGQFALAVVRNGRGDLEIIPRANRYSSGQRVTLGAIPESSQMFIGWSGDAAGTENPLTILMDQSKIITATFTKRPQLGVVECLGELNGELFKLFLIGELGERYDIEGSSDLINWTTVSTVTNSFGTVEFSEPVGTNSPRRFYRAVRAIP